MFTNMPEAFIILLNLIAIFTAIATAIGFALGFLGGGIWIFKAALKKDKP